jgi:hypothetical protein
MYRYSPDDGCFREDEQQGENCATLIRKWIQKGQIDSFHAFLHYKRPQVEPLLRDFYSWCERENVSKPKVWINHSIGVTPTGLCPDRLQPKAIRRLAGLAARQIIGPAFGLKRYPLRNAFVRYRGDSPGSPYYVNDLLAANGVRYVWLNHEDVHRDRISLPEQQQNGRDTILQPVTMDDGVRYWRFDRCHGTPPGPMRGEVFLRDTPQGCDASHLITHGNLSDLCSRNGTCILYTHWTHLRSMPLGDETIRRFELLRRWSDEGRIWVTSTSRLLDWTRRRTFLRMNCTKESGRLVVEFDCVDDPIFGRESLAPSDLHRLSFRLRDPSPAVTISIGGQQLEPQQVHKVGDLYWLDTKHSSALRIDGEESRFRLWLSLTPLSAAAIK